MGGVEFIGRVVSNRMQKTVVVAVSYVVWMPKYKVYQKRTSRHKARDESNASVIGDIVRIRKSRKYSKETSYAVVETVRRANAYDSAEAAQLVAQKDAQRAALLSTLSSSSYQPTTAATAAALGAAAAAGDLGQPGGLSSPAAGDAWVGLARKRLDEASMRLAKLREMYDKEVGGHVPLSGGALAVANSGPGGTGSIGGRREGQGEGEAAKGQGSKAGAGQS